MIFRPLIGYPILSGQRSNLGDCFAMLAMTFVILSVSLTLLPKINLLENQQERKTDLALTEGITGGTFEEYWGSVHPGKGGEFGRYIAVKASRVTDHS